MGSNTSNTGPIGSTGNVATTAGSGGMLLFPDRVDLPFITVDNIRQSVLVTNAFYQDTRWDPFWWAWLVLADFASKTTAGTPDWMASTPVNGNSLIWPSTWPMLQTSVQQGFYSTGVSAPKPNLGDGAIFGNPLPQSQLLQPPTTNSQIANELSALATAAQDERADALAEIIAQSSEFLTYFMDLLSITPASNPATVRLMNVASLIGLYCALYWKGCYKRLRPSQLLPALLPPISIPGHASFPSGHATQSALISLCVQQALLAANGAVHDALAPGLDALAARVARNREIAGLHYPSDTVGGQNLAVNIFNNILARPANLSGAVATYVAVLTAATNEWIPK